MKRYDTLPEGLRGVYLRVMRSLGNQLTARGTSGIRSAEELGFLAERVGRIPREGDLGIFSIAKSYRGVFERIAEDDFRSYVVSKRLLQTRVVGFDGVVASVDVLDLSGFDESEEVDDSVAGCDVDDGFEDVETVEDEEDEDEDNLDFEDVEEEEDNSLDFEDVEEEEDNSLDFEDVEEDEDEDGLDFEDVEEEEDSSLDFEDVEEEDEDGDEDSLDFEDVEEDEDEDGLDFEDVEEEDEDEDGLDFEDVEEDEDEDNSLDFEDVEEDEDGDNLDFEDVEEDEDEDNSLDFEDDDAEDSSNSQSSRTVGTSSRGDTRRRPAAQQAPTPGIRKDWSRIRGVEGNESMETVLSGVESLFSKLRGRRS